MVVQQILTHRATANRVDGERVAVYNDTKHCSSRACNPVVWALTYKTLLLESTREIVSVVDTAWIPLLAHLPEPVSTHLKIQKVR
jgi:hypothetical protein